MAKSEPRLGRGLTSLIRPQSPAAPAIPAEPPSAAAVAGPREIPTEAIRANAAQPRKKFDDAPLQELAASIRTHGILQPLIVRARGDGFELIAGERRLRAARLAGLPTVPAIVKNANDSVSLEIALIENLQREDLTTLERARAYQQYLDTFGGQVDRLAERLGESRSNVANYLRLLTLSPAVQELLASGELGMGQARALIGVPDTAKQLALARMVVRRNLSVRQVESLVKADGDPGAKAPARTAQTTGHLRDVERGLSKALGVSVSLRAGRKKNSGQIVIRYNSLEEFDRIAERIGGRVTLGD